MRTFLDEISVKFSSSPNWMVHLEVPIHKARKIGSVCLNTSYDIANSRQYCRLSHKNTDERRVAAMGCDQNLGWVAAEIIKQKPNHTIFATLFCKSSFRAQCSA